MVRKELFLKYLLPLFLISPMINVGGFGFSFAEILAFFYGTMLLFASKKGIELPKIVLVFFTLIVIGRIGALINSFEFNLPFNYTKFIFLFYFLIAILSYVIGRNSELVLGNILLHKFTKRAVIATCLIALAYVVADAGTRMKLLFLFMPTGLSDRVSSPRFPGLGINANLYSFFVYLFLLFSLKNYFDHKTNFTVSFFCILIIILCASKTTIILSFLAFAVFATNSYFFKRGTPPERKRDRKKSAIGLWVLVGFVIVGVIISTNKELAYYITLFDRFNELLSGEGHNSIDDRGELWALGWERIQLAPYFGIDVVQPDKISDSIPLYFANPHNEFLYYWMSLGIVGFAAYVIFVLYLLGRNLLRFKIAWVLFYLGLIVQMLVDGAFQSLKFQFFFFILLGLNYNELKMRKNINGSKIGNTQIS